MGASSPARGEEGEEEEFWLCCSLLGSALPPHLCVCVVLQKLKTMAKKRKSDKTGLDEVERTMYTSFCTAANSLSQLYSQAQHQQKIAFQAGERQALEKMFQWMLRQHELGSKVAISDIFSYLQSELDYGGDRISMHPGPQYQHQSPAQQPNHLSTSSSRSPAGEGAQTMNGLSPRLGHSDQNKNNVFCNASSSPLWRGLPPFHIAQNGYSCANNVLQVENGGTGCGFAIDADHGGQAPGSPQHAEINGMNSIRCQMGASVHTYGQLPPQNKNANLYTENDSHMDTHADGSAYGFYQRG